MGAVETKRFVKDLYLPPGTQEAKQRGCTCPPFDDTLGDTLHRDWTKDGEALWTNETCKFHGRDSDIVERVKAEKLRLGLVLVKKK